jgi:hypothetical protein
MQDKNECEKRVNEVTRKLLIILQKLADTSDEEIFYMAIEDCLNTHPSTELSAALVEWSLLAMPKQYDLEAVMVTAHKTAAQAYRMKAEASL